MFGKRAILPLILILASVVLFLMNLLHRSKWDSFLTLAMVSNLLVIAAMVLVLIGNRRRKG